MGENYNEVWWCGLIRMFCVSPSFGFVFRASENFSIQSFVFHGGDPPSFSSRQCSAYRVWASLQNRWFALWTVIRPTCLAVDSRSFILWKRTNNWIFRRCFPLQLWTVLRLPGVSCEWEHWFCWDGLRSIPWLLWWLCICRDTAEAPPRHRRDTPRHRRDTPRHRRDTPRHRRDTPRHRRDHVGPLGWSSRYRSVLRPARRHSAVFDLRTARCTPDGHSLVQAFPLHRRMAGDRCVCPPLLHGAVLVAVRTWPSDLLALINPRGIKKTRIYATSYERYSVIPAFLKQAVSQNGHPFFIPTAKTVIRLSLQNNTILTLIRSIYIEMPYIIYASMCPPI